MTTTIVKAADAAQFLSFVPRMLGYHPTRSLVVIPFHGSRTLGAMRIDLPDSASTAVDAIASTVIGMVCRLPEADGLATVAYTGASFAEHDGMPHRELAEALAGRADECGLRVVDALCVAADAWGSYLDPSCPDGGRPLADLAAVAPELAELPPPVGDQASGADLPAVDLAERERVGRALTALEAAVAVLCGPDAADAGRRGSPFSPTDTDSAETDPADTDPDGGVGLAEAGAAVTGDGTRIDPRALEAVCLLDDLPDLFEDALAWDLDAVDPYRAAALAWCLSRPSLRDVALVQWSGTMAHGDEAFDAQLRWENGEEYPTHLAMRMWGEGDRPDPGRLEAALHLVRRIAAAAPRGSRSGPLAMCAWLSWALGRSTHAEAYATWACEIEPEHGLSEIVLSFVHAGHLPDWAFRRPERP
ncbi:DUF4192 family protein [Microbacterium sp. CFH 90308]|uniref:DUF4192 family protein n=1 Tax=Microbacterium salsuginis TaxID=2722803 RepID=A0ABX1KG87_9MICO|nr:DUF4192 family protein [Microbacterium sp. CFH 90308]NLP85119.1 DUF4192 family protein [Microbacterium sp. CFH 90308]